MGNPNLSSGQVVPGFYGYVDYNTQGSGPAPDNRVLLWGYVTSVAQRTPNQPFSPASQQEADDGCGRGSDLANIYAACVAQPETQGAEVWVMPISEPVGGVASTYKLTVFITTGSNPAKPGTLQVWINSVLAAQVGFTTTDTATTIGAALATALTAAKDLPIATAVNSAGVVTITYIHKGTTGEDFPIRSNIQPAATNVQLSPGQALFATNATGAGTVTTTIGTLTVSTALAGGETPSAIATKVAASFTADTYPVTAVTDVGTPAQVDFYFNNNRDVRRMSMAIVTTTGTTVNLGSGATNGAGSAASITYNGTQGTGAPVLTSALANLGAHESYRSWAEPWLDTATIGAIATSLELASNGSITGQKLQHLTFCDAGDAMTVAGAIPVGTSPDLTQAAPHYAELWAPDAAVPGVYLAARAAGARAALWLDTPQKNWNGFRFQASTRSPLLLPPLKPSLDTQNTALRTYALAPVVKGRSGLMELVKGRTTSLAADKRLWAWSAESQAAFHVFDLKGRYAASFSGGSILRYSTPKAPGLFDSNSIESETRKALRAWEAAGNYDGADLLAPAVVATPDPNNPFRFNTQYPESPVVDLDQIVFTGQFVTPGA